MQSHVTTQSGTNVISIANLLSQAVEARASDVHLHSNYPPLFRINGSVKPMGEEILAEVPLTAQLVSLLDQKQQTEFAERKDIDFTYAINGVGRFRGSMFLTQSGINASFRVVPPNPLSLAELGLPEALVKFTEFHHGLVLLTGPAGCGKSTTLAALVDLVNQNHSGSHILTLEDPIEIMHKNKQCIINQRQVPLHSQSFARAVRAALREDPDVIIIGEMRDAETISLALTAAETGHLVMASMHTTDAVKSITRIVDSFPPERQSQIRTMLSESLQGVFSQLLLPTEDGTSRAVAYELLFVNTAVANLIRDKKTFQIPSIMQLGRAQGMITLSQSIGELVRAGKISRETAKRYAEEAYF